MIALVLLACAIDLGTQHAGPIEVRLRVFVPAEGVGPGLAWVRVEIDVSGPPGLEVDGPRLEDPRAAWRVALASSAWTPGSVECSLRLDQTKGGVAPLPGIALRVRESPDAEWREVEWPGPLHDLRDVPPPEKVADPPPAACWHWAAAALGLGAVGAISGLVWWLRLPRFVAMLPPAERARRAVAEANSCDEVERALRDYAAERFGVAAHAMTQAELVAALRPHADEDSLAILGQALRLCEEARFGPTPSSVGPATTGTLARRFIDATAQEGEKDRVAKRG